MSENGKDHWGSNGDLTPSNGQNDGNGEPKHEDPNLGKPQNKDFDKNVAQRLIDGQALDLRSQGLTYAMIAKTQECDIHTAHDRVMRALEWTRKHLGEVAQDVRDFEVAKLDRIERGVIRQAMGYKDDEGKQVDPDPDAIEIVLRTMEKRAKYLGLYGPIKFAPTTPEGDAPFELVLETLTIEEKRLLIKVYTGLEANQQAIEQG